MAEFTVRVELHGASWNDYVQLAANLSVRNITDVLAADDGRRYKMPPGEYQCHGELTAVQVREIAADCARPVGRGFAVLVTESAGRAWEGLPNA